MWVWWVGEIMNELTSDLTSQLYFSTFEHTVNPQIIAVSKGVIIQGTAIIPGWRLFQKLLTVRHALKLLLIKYLKYSI